MSLQQKKEIKDWLDIYDIASYTINDDLTVDVNGDVYLAHKNSYPTHCEHDILMIMDVTKRQVSKEDKKELDDLGFFWNDEFDCWASYKYGSA
ncbi:hypothetical protein GW796_08450 [archaeon]|nr:hypothetical protein [archaeon]